MTDKERRKLNHLFPIFVSQKHFLFIKQPEDFKHFEDTTSPSFVIPSDELVCLDEIAKRAYEDFFTIIMEDSQISRRFSASSVDKIIKKRILAYLEDAAQGHAKDLDLRQSVENIVQELLTGGEELEFQFLVNGLRLDDLERFDFGRAIFARISKEIAEEIFPDIDFSKKAQSGNVCPPVPEERQEEIKAGRRQKRRSVIGHSLIKVVANGDLWRSSQEAYRESQITLGALSIYPIIFTFDTDKPALFRFSLSGATPEDFGRVIGRDIKSGEMSFLMGIPFSLPAFQLKAEYLERFRKYGFEEVSRFLNSRSETSEVDKALETSLFWLGEAASDKLMPGRLTKYFTAIESLIIGPHRIDSIVSTVAARLAVLVGETPEEARKIKKDVETTGGLYDLRSQTAHAGKSEVEETKKVFQTGALAAWAFLSFLRARGYSSLGQAIEKLDQVSSKIFEKLN